MQVQRIEIAGYRSIKRLSLPLGPLTVLVGPNGSGKTNLYRALELLHDASEGRLARSLASEGGVPSVTWAGPRRAKEPVRIDVTVSMTDLAYELSLGPVPTAPSDPTLFRLDPEVKEERLHVVQGSRRFVAMERQAGSATLRDGEGRRTPFPLKLWAGESVLVQIAEPHRFPLMAEMLVRLRAWRFYHHFRTDLEAPVRAPQIGVRTAVLAHDGADLAAALQTIVEIGDAPALARGVDEAFPASRVEVQSEQGRFSVLMHQPGLLRPLAASELSDGTLRYLCLLAALLSPRPPPFIALNEPEMSLHSDLLAPLGKLIAEASQRSQIWVTTHSEPLASAIARHSRVLPLRLGKKLGATVVVGDSGDEAERSEE